MHMQIMQYVGPIRSSPKEKFAHYIKHIYNWWWCTHPRALIPVVSSSETSLRNHG
jgi:hypothetical protein